MAPVSKQWRVEKSQGHWHVRISRDEVLDVNTKENARLIASAPELLNALKLALIYLHPENSMDESDVVYTLNNAIRKAEK